MRAATAMVLPSVTWLRIFSTAAEYRLGDVGDQLLLGDCCSVLGLQRFVIFLLFPKFLVPIRRWRICRLPC